MMRPTAIAAFLSLPLVWGCAADHKSRSLQGFAGPNAPEPPPIAQDGGDDRSLCEYHGEPDREVVESAGPGATRANVRRVFLVVGEGPDRRRVLVCREIDTNLDGIKDVVRKYSAEGQSREEVADSDFDGKLDTWITFTGGRLADVRLDRNGDEKPDEWKTYARGQLVRIKRDTNFDGKPNVWEMYRASRLERMGTDVDGDGRVDRWDHDTEWRRRLDETARQQEEEAQRKKKEEIERLRAEADEGEQGPAAADPSAGKSPKTEPTPPGDPGTPPTDASVDEADDADDAP